LGEYDENSVYQPLYIVGHSSGWCLPNVVQLQGMADAGLN
jgi:hypothetical protein